MVSGDRCNSGTSGNVRRSHPAIRPGDQRCSSAHVTNAASSGCCASRQRFGRRAAAAAARSAASASYAARPLCAATSRLIVDGARSSVRAISRKLRPIGNARAMCCRSVSDSTRSARVGSRGAMPAAARMMKWMEPGRLPTALAIAWRDSPARCRVQSSINCSPVKPRGLVVRMGTPPFEEDGRCCDDHLTLDRLSSSLYAPTY